MSFEAVDIYIKDSLHGDPIPSVVVRIYSKDGKTFFTQTCTSIDGVASFLLNTQDYQLRFYKQHVALPNPTYLTVLASPATNVFDIVADLVVPPSAIDPRLCTAYGFFRRPDGTPATNIDVHFIAKFKPLVLDGDALVTERIIERTDKTGYLQVNLIRCGQYDVTVEGIEDQQRIVTVPDSPNIGISALLFPVVDRVIFDPPGPWNVEVGGDDLAVTPTVYGSDGNQLESWEVLWTSSDNQVLGVLPAANIINIRGLSAGTAQLIGVRANQTIVRIPDTPIQGLPVTVTIT